jgi:hypothetical protein
MSVTTKTGAKIGQTTWQALVMFDNGSEVWAETVGSREYPFRAKGLAINYARTLLAQQTNPPRPESNVDVPRYWAQVARGTYQDNSFYDDRFGGGQVTDGTWEYDHDEHGSQIGRYFWLNDDNVIEETDL